MIVMWRALKLFEILRDSIDAAFFPLSFFSLFSFLSTLLVQMAVRDETHLIRKLFAREDLNYSMLYCLLMEKSKSKWKKKKSKRLHLDYILQVHNFPEPSKYANNLR